MVRRKRKKSSSVWLKYVKEQVLDEAMGQCQCNRSSHDHIAGACSNPHDNYFHYRSIRNVNTPHNIIVVCSPCHKKIVASRRRIY